MNTPALFAYYYFLARRRYGHRPAAAATWARDVVKWWDDNPETRGFMPRPDHVR